MKKLIAVALVAMSLYATHATATPMYTYQTILDLTPAGVVGGIDTVVIDWETTTNTGTVSASDLSYLSIALLAGASNLYTDISIIGGVVQDIGGNSRPTGDVFWSFNHGDDLLYELRNAFDSTLFGSTGTQFSISDNVTIPTDGLLRLQRFTGGGPSGGQFATVLSQSTRLLRVVPEPGTLALLGIGLAGMGIVRRRKKV